MSNSAEDWLTITRNEGEAGWARFYKAYIGQSLSQPKTLLDAVERLGHLIVFDAIVSASFRDLKGDALPYVMAIALAKFNEQISGVDEAGRYNMNLAKSKERIARQNEEIEEKIRKAREISNVPTK